MTFREEKERLIELNWSQGLEHTKVSFIALWLNYYFGIETGDKIRKLMIIEDEIKRRLKGIRR